jgi:hypothetical protein
MLYIRLVIDFTFSVLAYEEASVIFNFLSIEISGGEAKVVFIFSDLGSSFLSL